LLRTLHGYLTRDLLKTMLLTLAAITLLMTVLAIIKPLRQMGLAGTQVLQLFGFTLPVMLSFTLPVATLFAAAQVYGRFSQDNELLASRASGISTIALLKPALALGAIVTVVSLVLSNLIAPKLVTVAGLAQANVRGIVYHRLKTRGYVDFVKKRRGYILHADHVDTETDTLYGVVCAQIRQAKPSKDPNKPPKGGGVLVASAASARLRFVHDPPPAQVIILPDEPSLIELGEGIGPGRIPNSRTARFVLPLEPPIKEKPSWYSWHRLLDTLKHPTNHSEIDAKLESIKQLICSDLLAREVVNTLTAGRPYTRLVRDKQTYSIEAPAATLSDDGEAVLTAAPGPDGKDVLVTVSLLRGPRVVERITARLGTVEVRVSALTQQPEVTLKLQQDVTVVFIGPEGERPARRTDWGIGEIPVPAQILRRAREIRLIDLYERPKEYTQNRKIIDDIDMLRTWRIPRLRLALIAELHARIAYGLSCFLMVAMGAALGLIFRGGQFITAFAISAVPAAVVIALLLMGKGMVRNPDVSAGWGLACIWGGIVLLLLADVLIYWRLARR
jgi:lipopolysaccharide export LptBFGC system permease protein LptF